MCFNVLDKVVMTSAGFAFAFVRGVKIAAKASSVTVLGKLLVVEIGRWREKKAEALISARGVGQIGKKTIKTISVYLRIGVTCCVLGTLGRWGINSSLPFTVEFAATSFAFFVLACDFCSPSILGFDALALLCDFGFVGAAGTVCPSATPFEPSAGLEGFEEENRL